MDVVITGIGLVSCLGEGAQAHWRALSAQTAAPILDSQRHAPYTIHPLPAIDWSKQIAKRGDQRQMEIWQRLGTYAAGLALDDAAIKDDEALCGTMDMIVAAGGGERDEAVDGSILDASAAHSDQDVLVNEKLVTELRPTLFLAQLSNLLAGNISIVHKVTGSSRTFMGEEGAGVSALESAFKRIASGQSSHILVGGAFQTEHPDMLLGYELGGFLHRGPWSPLWQRTRHDQGGGVVTGSGGAFLVLESREHAARRNRPAYAVLRRVVAARAQRGDDRLADSIGAMIDDLDRPSSLQLVVSGASGAHAATSAEKRALDARELAVRAFATRTGHLKEAQFPFAIALAALALANRAAYPAFDRDAEKPARGEITAALATTIGYHRFEGAALVEVP